MYVILECLDIHINKIDHSLSFYERLQNVQIVGMTTSALHDY